MITWELPNVKISPSADGDDVSSMYAFVSDAANDLSDIYNTEHRETFESCETCARKAGGPRHFGSQRCRSGSIAAGYHGSHCSCDACY